MAAEPQEPKRPQNAYWIFLAENREKLSKSAGSNSGPAVGKIAGESWKAMSESEKAPYETKAKAAKAEYEKAMEAFKAQGGVAGKRRAAKAEAKVAKRPKKDAVDPNKPKKPPSAYWIWLAENRPALVAEVGKNDMPQVAKLGSAKWKVLSEKDKTVFEEKAAVEKEKYHKALEEYTKSGGAAAAAAGDAGEEDEA